MSIAVLGGGIVGLSIAFRLAEAGWAVAVFDHGQLGGEASWAGAGMLAPGGEIEQESPLAAPAIASRSLYRPFVDQLERESGLSIDMQEAGALELAYSTAEATALAEKAELQKGLAITSRAVDINQVVTFWPRVRREGLVAARFYPGDAIVDPRDVVAALRVALGRRGVSIYRDTRVTDLDVSEAGTQIGFDIRPSVGFDAAVVAMGAWSSGLAVSGVPALPRSEPVKGHLIAYLQPEQTCGTIVRLGHTYLLQRANGLLIVGASVERVGFEPSVQAHVVSNLERQASLVFPHLAETTPTAAWTGFRPGSDSLFLGPWHSPRLQLAYGHYRNGILLAPWTAVEVRDQLSASLGTP